MKKIILSALCCLSTLLSTPSMSQSSNTLSNVYLTTGMSKIFEDDRVEGYTGKLGTLGLFLGIGYTINRFALEASYHLLSLSEISSVYDDIKYEISVRGLAFSGKYHHPITDQFDIYGRLGHMQVKPKVKVLKGQIDTSLVPKSAELIIIMGLGGRYKINNNMSLSLEYNNLYSDEENNNNNDDDDNLFLARFGYHF